METILWFAMLLSNFFSTLLAIYFYLLHEDFKNEKITAYNLTQILSKYIPIEIIFQLLVTILSFIHRSYFLFICLIPLAIFNALTLIRRSYKIYGFTASECHYQSKQLQNVMKYKSLIYLIFCLSIGFKFSQAFTRMAIYRINFLLKNIDG